MSTLRHGLTTTERSDEDGVSYNGTMARSNMFIDLNEFVMGLNSKRKLA